jgi:hypothetical protein
MHQRHIARFQTESKELPGITPDTVTANHGYDGESVGSRTSRVTTGR